MKEKIINAALLKILEHGFRGFTVDDICRSISMSKKTVYKYFDSKDEIIHAVVDFHIENDKQRTIKVMESDLELIPKLKSVILHYYDYKVPLELVRELEFYFPKQWEKVKALVAYKQELFKGLIEDSIHNGKLKSDFNINVLMLTFEKTLPAIMNYDFLVDNDVEHKTVNKLMDDFLRIIFNGILV